MRELEVLRGITGGLTTSEIAEELTLTAGTVKWHIGNLYGKLDARNRAQVLACPHLGLVLW